MATYHIETYGCTSNRGESRSIESALRDAGHYRVDGPKEADVSILNSCTVVEKTERNMLRRAEELDEQTADLIVTGCMALAQGEEFADVDARVLHWEDVPTAVTNGECPTTTPDAEPVLDGVVGILPIARGCMSNCSYCITKFATGRVDSPSVEENVRSSFAPAWTSASAFRTFSPTGGLSMRPVANFVMQYEQLLMQPRAMGRIPTAPSRIGSASGVAVGHSPFVTAVGTSSQWSTRASRASNRSP